MISEQSIPQAEYAIIGGSATYKIDFPGDLANPEIKIIVKDLVFTTPFGMSPPLKLFSLAKKNILTAKMHGWRRGIPRAEASKQLFWILKEAGVKKIIADGSVGAVNHLIKPRDIILPSDYLDFSLRKDIHLSEDYLLAMRQAVCPQIRKVLLTAARTVHPGKIYERAVYAVTEGRHFESPAEVAMFRLFGADVVGQSMCPEVYLAREIGACYGRIELVANYAEGVIENWDYEELKDIYFQEAKKIGQILLQAVSQLSNTQECGCKDLRYRSLLQE